MFKTQFHVVKQSHRPILRLDDQDLLQRPAVTAGNPVLSCSMDYKRDFSIENKAGAILQIT
jgi:hypothetical protein